MSLQATGRTKYWYHRIAPGRNSSWLAVYSHVLWLSLKRWLYLGQKSWCSMLVVKDVVKLAVQRAHTSREVIEIFLTLGGGSKN